MRLLSALPVRSTFGNREFWGMQTALSNSAIRGDSGIATLWYGKSGDSSGMMSIEQKRPIIKHGECPASVPG